MRRRVAMLASLALWTPTAINYAVSMHWQAPTPAPSLWGRGGPRSIELGASSTTSGNGASQRNGTSQSVATAWVPACAANSPSLPTSVEALCAQAFSLCASTADPSDLMFWIYQGPVGVKSPSPGQWRLVSQVCMRTRRERGRVIPSMTVDDFRRLPLPPVVVHVQPASLRTLVNVETNVFVDSRPTLLRTSLLGVPVRVRATPVAYRWNFGDGARLVTADPGGPYPRMTTTHVYHEAGIRQLELVTVYRGEYATPDGPWIPIDGTADVPSGPLLLEVVEAHNHLVE